MILNDMKVIRLKFFEGDNSSENTVTLEFDENFEGFVVAEGGVRVISQEVNSISFYSSSLTAQLCAVDDDFAAYRNARNGVLDTRAWTTLLRGSDLGIARSLIKEGEPIPGSEAVAGHDMFVTKVTSIRFSNRAVAALDNFFMNSL